MSFVRLFLVMVLSVVLVFSLQVCSNGTRVYVERPIYQTFVNKLVERVKAIKLGDPMLEDTTMGAIISAEQAERVMAFIDSAKEEVSFACVCLCVCVCV